jgi:hypothetical protein
MDEASKIHNIIKMFFEILLSWRMCGVRGASARSATCIVMEEEWGNF